MTEAMLLKLEEKMMMVLGEWKLASGCATVVTKKMPTLKYERETHSRKLQDLVSLLDAMTGLDSKIQPMGIPFQEPIAARDKDYSSFIQSR